MLITMIINVLCASIIYALSMGLVTAGEVSDVEVMNESPVTIMFWNLENFFDFRDDGTSESDAEFSATGERRWTKTRFFRKCLAVAKTILWAGSTTSGGVPDIVGVAEVENRFVLTQLVTKTALRKLDYGIVHFDSPDPRGIDCGLLYRESRLTLVSAKPCPVNAPGLQTRDILLAQFITVAGDSLARAGQPSSFQVWRRGDGLAARSRRGPLAGPGRLPGRLWLAPHRCCRRLQRHPGQSPFRSPRTNVFPLSFFRPGSTTSKPSG